MTNRLYPPEFWEIYLEAKEQAEKNQAGATRLFLFCFVCFGLYTPD